MNDEEEGIDEEMSIDAVISVSKEQWYITTSSDIIDMQYIQCIAWSQIVLYNIQLTLTLEDFDKVVAPSLYR